MTTTTTSRPGFFGRLGRAIVAFLKVVFFLALFAGILAAAWFGFGELRRSFDNFARRDDLNAQQIEGLRAEMSALDAERAAQDKQLVALTEDMEALTEQLTADLDRQQEMLGALETQLADVAANSEVAAGDVDSLSDGVIALQGDMNENLAAVDELGGNVDQLGMSVTALGEDFSDLETAVMGSSEEAMTAVTDMGQALTLFRAWEMVYRARLRLLEQNVGLATEDVAVAQALLTMLVENSEAESAGTLAAVQGRLDLAAAGLLDDADTAVRDLESAWEMLDMILSDLLGVPEIVLPETAVISPTVTLTATQPITTSP